MSDVEISKQIEFYAQHYPNLIGALEAAKIADVPIKTIYHWSSTGQLDGCKSKRGRHLRLGRDCFVLFLLNNSPKAIH
jgi:hypothetical protein